MFSSVTMSLSSVFPFLGFIFFFVPIFVVYVWIIDVVTLVGYTMRDIEYQWGDGDGSIGMAQIQLPQFTVLGHRRSQKHVLLSTGISSLVNLTSSFFLFLHRRFFSSSPSSLLGYSCLHLIPLGLFSSFWEKAGRACETLRRP